MTKLVSEMEAFFRDIYPGENRTLVPGEGEIGASIMLVGEAPGAQEALTGRPFVGKAGQNLDAFLEATGFDRASLYVTNTVKFRPTRISAAGNVINRPPTREEVELFLPFLKREIELVGPKCVVTLGNTALQALQGRKAVIGDLHGRFIRLDKRLLFPIYHPASLIYNPSLAEAYRRDLTVLSAWREGNERIPTPPEG